MNRTGIAWSLSLLLACITMSCSKKPAAGATAAVDSATAPAPAGDAAPTPAAAEQILKNLTATLAPERPLTEATDPRKTAGRVLAGLFAVLPVDRLGTAAGDVLALAAKMRETWGCQPRGLRPDAAAQEEFLVGAISTATAVLNSGVGGELKGKAETLLVDALRESPEMQDVAVHRAAADAIFAAAAGLTVDTIGRLAPALVEALFIDPVRHDPATPDANDRLLPHARRTLVRLALRGDAERAAVVTALVQALALELEPEQRELQDVDHIALDRRVALRALPCGRLLGTTCPEKETLLEQEAEAKTRPAQASCNRGLDPERPGSGFDWGFEDGRIWDTVGDVLVDVLPPWRGGVPAASGAPGELATRILVDQLGRAGTWVDDVAAERSLLDGIVRLRPSILHDAESAAPAGDSPVGTGGGAAAGGRTESHADARAAPSAAVQAAADALAARHSQGAPRSSIREATQALLTACSAPGAPPGDVTVCTALLIPALQDVQVELARLADWDDDFAAMDRLLWCTQSAARTLGMLGIVGANDGTLRTVLRFAQFSFDNLPGFRITQVKAFPEMVLRTKALFDEAGRPRIAMPVLPALLDAVANYQHPSPPVLEFLLGLIGSPALSSENSNATIAAERFTELNADVMTFRTLAVRTFLQTFRRAADLPDADRYLERFRFLVGDVLPLTALEKTADSDPGFQLWPPEAFAPVEPGGPVAEEAPVVAWTSSQPARPPLYSFDTYRDALAKCALGESESRADVAHWRHEMTDEQKTQYCKKWVEPWATESADEMRTQDIPKLGLDDQRCYLHMKAMHDNEFQYCVALEQRQPPAQQLHLTSEQCKAVRELDDTYLYCVDLRFQPEYLERGKPTLWGCYDKFPWLRNREPFGPGCRHLAQRILGAWLYVKLRGEAGTAAPDGVTFDALQSIMPLDDFFRFLRQRASPAQPEPPLPAKLLPLVQELAKVQLDFPEFVRPPDQAAGTARATVPKPEDAESHAPLYAGIPWFRHEGWTTRVPRDFAGLLTDFLAAPGEPNATSTTSPDCATNGSLACSMSSVLEGGAPGPLLQNAAGLAVTILREDIVGLDRIAAAVEELASCSGPAGVDAACADALLTPPAGTDPDQRVDQQVAALYLLAAGASTVDAAARAAFEASLCRMVSAAADRQGGLDERLRPAVQFAFLRAKPACGATGGAAGSWSPAWASILDPTGAWSVTPLAPVPAAVPTPGTPGSGSSLGALTSTGLAAELRLGEAISFGGLAKEVIRGIVSQNRGRIRHCYEAALRTQPDLEGEVTVKFVIDTSGVVQSADSIGNTTGNAALAECITNVVKRMTFPQAVGVTAVTYPFLLNTTGSSPATDPGSP